jgi:hypothetical protein
MATPKTAAIFCRSAGLGVQRPRAMAVTRPSSSPLRWASSATVSWCSWQRSATDLDIARASQATPLNGVKDYCATITVRLLASVLKLYRILAVSIIPIDGI